MSKYRGLTDHLTRQSGREWRTSFEEVDQLLGGALPTAARSGVGWWANDAGKAQAKAWMGKGWQVRDVDPKAGTVIFMKAETDKPRKAKGGASAGGGKTAPGSAKAAAKPKPAAKAAAPRSAKPRADAKPTAGAAPAPQAVAPAIETARPADGEPAFLEKLPGGNKTAVIGGIAAAVLGVGALVARAFMRKR